MNLYPDLADDNLRGRYDEASIGLILCKTNNKIVVEYALRDTTKPIGIAEYKISQKLPVNIKGKLPSIEAIQKSMDKELKKTSVTGNKRLTAVKRKIKSEKM